MAATTFGAALGTLIKSRRKAKGLTQTQLAEDAYGSAGKTRRISELESGLVSNPHPKTIDPLISVLGITEDEIEKCAKDAGARPDPDLDRAYREARNLIEALARQFENDNAGASMAELDEFLREKAREWAQLRQRLSAIEAVGQKISNIRTSAEGALNEGRFDEVDALLLDAEDIQQQSKTLKEIGQQAILRILRGDAQLLKGDENRAFELYLGAANFFMPFDKAEGIRLIQYVAGYLYEAGRRSFTKTFLVAARLLEAAEKMEQIWNDPTARSKIRFRLSLLYRSAAERSRDQESLDLLKKATSYARESLSDLGDTADPYDVTSAKVSLGNCLFETVKRTRDEGLLSEAIFMLRSSRDQLLQEGAGPTLLACVHNSLGGALMQNLDYGFAKDEDATLKESVSSFQSAIAAAEKYGDVEVWGVAHNNLGNALARIAKLQSTKPKDRGFLNLRATAAVMASIEAYPQARFPFHFAEAQTSLARIYWDMAANERGQNIEAYLARCLNSWMMAEGIYGKEQFPEKWAQIQMHIGAAFGAHASIDGIQTARDDLLNAHQRFGDALEVFRERNMREEIEYCESALKLVAKRRAQFGDSANPEET